MKDTGCIQALDVEWIEIELPHQQGLSLGVGEAERVASSGVT